MRADVHPWRIFLDQEGADSIRAPCFVHRGKHDEQVGYRTIGDENFAAVEDVTGAFLDGGGSEAECVRAAIGFAHGVAADERSVRKAGQVFFLLCFGAVIDERNDRRPHVGVDGEEQAVIFAGIPEALEGCHGSEWISAEPAVVGRDEQALDAEIAAFFPGLMVENAVAIVLDHVVVKLLACKTADCVQ